MRFLFRFSPPTEPDLPDRACLGHGLDQGHAFAIHRGDQQRSSFAVKPKGALGVKTLKIHAGFLHDLFRRPFRQAHAGRVGQFLDRLVKGAFDGRFD